MSPKKLKLVKGTKQYEVAKYQAQALNRTYYIQSLGFTPYEWQKEVLNSKATRKIINGARQGGKSTVIAGTGAHNARFFPGSLTMIGAPMKDQAKETMQKIIAFCMADPDYPPFKKCSTEEVELLNGSRIIVRAALSGSFRSYSHPKSIILDEASRIEDEAYTSGARPMLTMNKECELILISTPNGREGFFYNTFSGATKESWSRWEVRSPFTPSGTGVDMTLNTTLIEFVYKEVMKKRGVSAYFSPRHVDYEFQLEQLSAMGKQQYLQEYCCEFVEKTGQVFDYNDIERLFNFNDAQKCKALYVDVNEEYKLWQHLTNT